MPDTVDYGEVGMVNVDRLLYGTLSQLKPLAAAPLLIGWIQYGDDAAEKNSATSIIIILFTIVPGDSFAERDYRQTTTRSRRTIQLQEQLAQGKRRCCNTTSGAELANGTKISDGNWLIQPDSI